MASPTKVLLETDGVHIAWDDGHQSYHPHRYLRGACGCAHCVEEATGRRVVGYQEVAADVQAVDWLQIGRYAIQFLWSDLHETGIYPFDYLRDICQCPQCRERT